MSDTLQIFGKTFSNATGIVATDNTDTERTFIRPTGTMTIDENGTYDVSEYASAEVSVSGGGDEPIPEDGKTRIFIHIADDTPDNRLTFYLRFTASVENNTTVDWGDGTSETLGKTSAHTYSHKYSHGGDYVIAMTVNSGTISFDGTSGSNGSSIYGSRTSSYYFNRTRFKRIIFGDNVISTGGHACYNCYGLASVTISDNVTSIGSYTYYRCYSLASLTIPDSVTSIGASAFSGCSCLTSVTIPDSVTNIEASAFSNCYGIGEYHFKPTTPPTLANSNAFSGIYTDCIIYVPQGSLDAYKTATNWSSQASKMQEEPT